MTNSREVIGADAPTSAPLPPHLTVVVVERATGAALVSAQFPVYVVGGGGDLLSQHPAFSQRNVTVGAGVGGVLPRVHHERHPEAGQTEEAAHSDHDVCAQANGLLCVRHDFVAAVRASHLHRRGSQRLLRHHHHGWGWSRSVCHDL